MRYAYPTVEWVKDPVDLGTGLPNGRRISRRHFADCEHWYRNDDGSLVGGPPRLATVEWMETVAPCADCAQRARSNGHPQRVVPPAASLSVECAARIEGVRYSKVKPNAGRVRRPGQCSST